MANSSLDYVGEVIEVLPAGKYSIRLLAADIVVLGKLSGRMRMHKITIMEGDYVKIELSEYDMSQGRITYRFKDPQQAIDSQNNDTDNSSPSRLRFKESSQEHHIDSQNNDNSFHFSST